MGRGPVDDREAVAEALRRHDTKSLRLGFATCRCGWKSANEYVDQRLYEHRAHQADVILAALDLPARDARVRADALAPVLRLAAAWEALPCSAGLRACLHHLGGTVRDVAENGLGADTAPIDHHTATPDAAAAHARWHPAPADLAAADADRPDPADVADDRSLT